MEAALNLSLTVKMKRRLLGFQSRLRKTGVRGCLCSGKSASQKQASAQEKWKERVLAEQYDKSLSYARISDCKGLHSREYPCTLADLFFSYFAQIKMILSSKDSRKLQCASGSALCLSQSDEMLQRGSAGLHYPL